MSRWGVVVVAAASSLCAQGLVPEVRHIAGVVVDQRGNSVAEAHIDHNGAGPLAESPRTDAQGRFKWDTSAPAVVIRKSGYSSAFLPTEDASNVRLTLTELASKSPPICPKKEGYIGLDGWPAPIFFPKIKGVRIGQGSDVDFAFLSYSVKSKQGRKSMVHGSGPAWSFGLPSDLDVWRSRDYSERVIEFQNARIVDARGTTQDGKYWRYLGKIAESASYRDVDELTAKVFDQMMDGFCVKAYLARP